MTALPVIAVDDCWNTIGVRGDRSCPELARAVHCHNCPVFAAAGRRFLDAPSPPGYLEEWTERLAAPVEETDADLESVLTFRLAEEWLALPARVLVEVTTARPVHRVPYRAGLVTRVPRGEVGPPPATVARASAHLSRGVFTWEGRLVGLLDDGRLFEALRARLR